MKNFSTVMRFTSDKTSVKHANGHLLGKVFVVKPHLKVEEIMKLYRVDKSS